MSKLMNLCGSIAVLAVVAGCCSTAQTCPSSKPAAETQPFAPAVKAVPAAPVAVAPVPAVSVDKPGEFDKPGFVTTVVKGRLWVFAEGSEALTEFKAGGKTPAVHSTRIKAGPLGMTIIAPDVAVLDAYMN